MELIKIKVNANLSGAVIAKKGQVVTVSADQGAELIARGLAVEHVGSRQADKPVMVQRKKDAARAVQES